MTESHRTGRVLIERAGLRSDEPHEQRAPLLVAVEQSLPVPVSSSVQIVASLFALPSASFVLGAAVGD